MSAREPKPRPARLHDVSARRHLPGAVVPYLQMCGRWLEEHGFAIGSGVQVLVERGRVTLISEAVEGSVPPAAGE